ARGCYDCAMRTFAPGLALLAALMMPAGAAGRLPAGFVYLRDIDAGIAQDMRYAGSNNFTGRPLPGYGAAECVLRRDVAQALAKVQADLAREHLSLKVYDCYRPVRAVAAMARWARQPESPGAPTKRFFPGLEKRRLFALGYIAAHSAHSTGTAVDLTLVQRGAAPAAPFDAKAAYAPCTAPATLRAPDNSIDMGTGFDCFDAKSRTLSPAISAAQKRRRATLVTAMRARGLHNYFREWWHFSYGPRPARPYDFPIEAR
ncbi:MAG: M15 family metallopeptidase, partial [Pseudolabrys sp.]